MLAGLLALLGAQLAGEVTVRLTGLPVPGPVVGLLVFLLVLRVRKSPESDPLVQAPSALLRHLQLLFVPAGVGIVVHLTALRDQALPIAVGLWGSWLLGLIATGLVMTALLRVRRR